MLVVHNNQTSTWFKSGFPVDPLSITGDVILVIDPSKTNMAVLIGSPLGEVYSILEFSGNNRRQGPVMDNTVYCSEVKEYLKRYLSNCRVFDIGIEQAISKQGMNQHHSSMTLTEIRGVLLNLFLEEYGFDTKHVEVNNWSWKFDVLPEGYRSQKEKGSKRYFKEKHPTSPLNLYFEADVTDVVCIYQYLVKRHARTYTITCNKSEKNLKDLKIGIYPSYMDSVPDFRKFVYNNKFSLEDNSYYFGNRSFANGISSLNIDDISIEDIYKYACGFDSLDTDPTDIRVVVSR